MLHCVVEFCAEVLSVVMCSCMLCSVCYMLPRVITCCAVLLRVRCVQCCYRELLHCCAVLLHVTKSYYMMCNVVTCCIVSLKQCYCCDVFLLDVHVEYMLHCVVVRMLSVYVFLHVVQYCYMLPSSYYMLCNGVTCYEESLHAVQCCYMSGYYMMCVVTCCSLNIVQQC